MAKAIGFLPACESCQDFRTLRLAAGAQSWQVAQEYLFELLPKLYQTQFGHIDESEHRAFLQSHFRALPDAEIEIHETSASLLHPSQQSDIESLIASQDLPQVCFYLRPGRTAK